MSNIDRRTEPGRTAIRLVTALGEIVIELRADQAPCSVAAFLQQVDAGAFDGGAFWRIVRTDNDLSSPVIEVIQAACRPSVEVRLDIEIETTEASGLAHDHGTISLPRVDGGKGSAQSFFICVGPQPALDKGGGRTADGLGFAAFGSVIAGMEVVRAIHAVATRDGAPSDPLKGQIAKEPVAIFRIERLDNSPDVSAAGPSR